MDRLLRLTLLLLLLPALAGCALPPPEPPEAVLAPPGNDPAIRAYRKVAVLPFPSESEYPSVSAEWIAHRLAEGGRLDVVPPGRAELLFRDASFPWTPADLPREMWRRAASILGAEALVAGAVYRDPGPWIRFRAVLRVVDGRTGETVYRDEVRGKGVFGNSDYPFWLAATDEAGRVLRERFLGVEAPSPAPAPAPRGDGLN